MLRDSRDCQIMFHHVGLSDTLFIKLARRQHVPAVQIPPLQSPQRKCASTKHDNCDSGVQRKVLLLVKRLYHHHHWRHIMVGRRFKNLAADRFYLLQDVVAFMGGYPNLLAKTHSSLDRASFRG
ncbi:hypothetical protein CEXT_390801 [Caerostris extrusa]|uniref:Uncharacterized protein n=1 Tax=Caerostris extrusa TaxID=172846 RepID=A0AAV4W7I1_CAEEX|nr:hypothetical protein CEXT_390801 [Caerostris extrusa]